MKTLLLTLLASSLLLTGCVAGGDGYGYQTGPATCSLPLLPPIPIPVSVNVNNVPTSYCRPRPYVVDRPIIPAGFPCPERVPAYSVARPVWGGSSVILLD